MKPLSPPAVTALAAALLSAAVVLALTGLLPAAAARADEPANLVANGDFSEAADGAPARWHAAGDRRVEQRLETARDADGNPYARLVCTRFEERGGASHAYRAGRELFRIASLVVQQFDAGQVVRPVIESLRDATGETCFFTMYLPAAREATVVEVARAPHPLRYQVERFTHIPLAWGALGRSILAHLPAEDVARILADAGPASATGRRLPAAGTLRAELSRIARRGYAISRGHNIAGAVGLASAVLDAAGGVVGSIGLTMPESRLTPAHAERFPDLVASHARRLSDTLGWRDPQRDAARGAG